MHDSRHHINAWLLRVVNGIVLAWLCGLLCYVRASSVLRHHRPTRRSLESQTALTYLFTEGKETLRCIYVPSNQQLEPRLPVRISTATIPQHTPLGRQRWSAGGLAAQTSKAFAQTEGIGFYSRRKHNERFVFFLRLPTLDIVESARALANFRRNSTITVVMLNTLNIVRDKNKARIWLCPRREESRGVYVRGATACLSRMNAGERQEASGS